MSTFSSVVLGKSPKRFYLLDDTTGTTMADIASPGSVNCTTSGSPTLAVAAVVGTGVQCDGVNDQIRMDNPGGATFGAGACVGGFYKTSASTSGTHIVWRDNSSSGGWLLGWLAGVLTIRVNGSDHAVSTPVGYSPANWYLYFLTVSGSQCKFYVGDPTTGTLTVTTWSQTVSGLWVGYVVMSRNGGLSSWYAGTFDSWGTWYNQTVLAQSDVQDILNAAIFPGVPSSVSSPSQTSTTIDLQWSAPVSGGTVDSYDVRIDGGSESTATSPHTFTGLSPGSSHTVSVRAVGPAGTSAWVDVAADTFAPPGVPTSVAVTDETTVTLELSWSAPASGGSVTSYDVRRDGGSASTATSPHTFTGLTPSTSYDLEVRAVGPGGSSSWVLVSGLTSDPVPVGYYRAALTLGAHSWEWTTLDEVDLLSDYPHVRLPLTLGWDIKDTVDFFPAQPDLTTLGFAVQCNDASDLADVVKGTTVTFRMYVDDAPDADPWQTFDGVVVQLDGETVVSPADVDRRDLVVTVFAADDNARLADKYVGYEGGDWPVEHIGERVDRICDEAGLVRADLGAPHGLGMVGWLNTRAEGSPLSALDALRQALKDAADDYDSEPPFEFYGRPVFQYWHANADLDDPETLGVYIFRRRVYDDTTVTLDGGLVRASGRWSKQPGPAAATWVIVDGVTFGTPDDTVPFVRNTSLFDTTAQPDPTNYSATERDNLGESLLPDGSTALDGWASRSLVYEAWRAEAAAPVALWASPQATRGFQVTPVVVTPIGPELELNAVDYVAGTLTGARLIVPPGGRFLVEFRLRAELLPNTTLP